MYYYRFICCQKEQIRRAIAEQKIAFKSFSITLTFINNGKVKEDKILSVYVRKANHIEFFALGHFMC